MTAASTVNVDGEELDLLRLELRERGLDAGDVPDQALATVLELCRDRGLAADALTMRPRPRWLLELLASSRA